MEEPKKEKKPVTDVSWVEEFSEPEQIKKWRDSAFQTALEKFRYGHGNPETVMRTGEAFGRGLFTQAVHEKSLDWTIQKWLQMTEEDVLKPLGTEFTFTKISPDAMTTFMDRNPLNKVSKESTIASLFMYGVIRGLFLSAFPKGELLLNEANIGGSSEFIFKAHASIKDKGERERVKRAFAALKKDYGT
jgi:hypothetical protein